MMEKNFKRPSPSVDAAASKWIRTKFQATDSYTENRFSLEPLLTANKVLGEQEGGAWVSAIAWSSPGLARHSRPALAVLTSNHILCIWASSNNVEASNSWERVLMINEAASTFSRVRSMEWAPTWPRKVEDIWHQRRTNIHILALGLDDAKVAFLDIRSPYTTDSGSWRVRTLDDIALNSDHGLRLGQDSCDIALTKNRYSLFGDAMKNVHCVKDIEFSPWTGYSGGLETTVSASRNDGTRWDFGFRVSDDLSEFGFTHVK